MAATAAVAVAVAGSHSDVATVDGPLVDSDGRCRSTRRNPADAAVGAAGSRPVRSQIVVVAAAETLATEDPSSTPSCTNLVFFSACACTLPSLTLV